MSNIKRLFKPKINRVITGLAIVVIIVVGSYVAYKNGVFADTSVACTVRLSSGISIQYDATQDVAPGGGSIVNGWPSLNLILNGTTTQSITNQNRYINVYGQGGSSYLYSKGSNKASAVPQPVQPEVKSATFDCTGGKTIEVTSANTSRTGTQQILFNVITPTTNTDGPYCISRIPNVDKQGTYQRTGTDYAWVSGEKFGGVDQSGIDSATGKPDYRAIPGACSTGGTGNNTGDTGEGGTTSADTRCVEYPIGSKEYATFTYSGAVWQNPLDTDQIIPSDTLGDYNQDDSGKECSGGLNGKTDKIPSGDSGGTDGIDKKTSGDPGDPGEGATTQTVPGCATGYSCYTIGGTDTKCFKTGEAPAPYTLVPSAQCTHQETTSATNPTTIGGNVQGLDPNVPVAGKKAAGVQYPNKINFTAYRVSYAETGQIVPMGGVTFTVKGHSSSRLAGEMVSVNYLKAPSSSTTILPHDEAKCSVITETTNLLKLFSVYNNAFTTPDNGATAMFTQAINVAPGYYEVTYSKKPGFSNTTNQKICFQVGKDDGASTPININVLLDAQPGAEPPGLMDTNGTGGVGYDKVNGKDEYRTKIIGVPYKYMPDFPWYGWQKNESYITGAPVGTTSAGLPEPGVSADYGTTANLQQYLSKCQNYGIALGTTISKDKLPWAGGLIGLATGLLNGKSSVKSLLGRTTAGILAGLGLGALSGDSGVNVSINIGQLNAQCQALYNNVIPPQCRNCFINGVYNASTCPRDCVQQVPFMQGLLQSNSSVFHF